MTEITKDLFMKLANKFFADPNKGPIFRQYCEDVGIRMDMTIEEMKTVINKHHNRLIMWYSYTINEMKDVRLPEIEKEIKELKENGFDAIPSYGKTKFDTFEWTGKDKTYTVSRDTKYIHNYHWHSTKEQCPNKTGIVVDDWSNLSKQMKKDFWRMQYTLYKYDRYMAQKKLKEARKQIAYSKRIIQKLDRLSEEEVRIYYSDVVKDSLEKK